MNQQAKVVKMSHQIAVSQTQKLLKQRAEQLRSKVRDKERLWITRALLAFQYISTPPKARGWWYLDDKKVVYGPFPPELMRKWFMNGQFSTKTPVRYGNHGQYRMMKDIFPEGKDIFPRTNALRGDIECAFASLQDWA